MNYDTRAFGAWLFVLVDGLFFGALFFIYAVMRRQISAWPDLDVPRLGFVQPLLAVGCVMLAGLLHRARHALPFAFFGVAAALVILALFWRGAAAVGVTPRAGKYGAVVYAFTLFWVLHLVGLLLALGIAILKRRDAAGTPLLGRFLMVQAVVGAVLCGLLFLW